MIEIIKRGTKHIVTCRTCGCMFSYEQEDEQIRPSEFCYGNDTIFVPCPQCQEEYILEQRKGK